MGQNADAAFLIFNPLKKRRVNHSFDGYDNVGARLIKQVLEQSGLKIDFCSADTAKRYPLILVSFTSQYDHISYFQQIAKHPDWQPGRRIFKILSGGFGMQNPTGIRKYMDYSFFGRAENLIVDIVNDILSGKKPEHDSLMNLPEIHPIQYKQAEMLSPIKIGKWAETFTGCPLKCKFCHFTFARKHTGSDEAYEKKQYVQNSFAGKGSVEVTWDQIQTWDKKVGMIRTALDGSSQRLRFILGKRITNRDIIAGVERMGSFDGGTGRTLLKIYNIGNFPTETENDHNELYSVLSLPEPKNIVDVEIHTTPFRPSLMTPMQWEGVNIIYDWSKHSRNHRIFNNKRTLKVHHCPNMESPWSHFINVMVDRLAPEDDKLFEAVCFSKQLNRLRSWQKLKLIGSHFNIGKITKEYEIGDPEHPGANLQSYIDNQRIQKIATKMRKHLKQSLEESDHLRYWEKDIVTLGRAGQISKNHNGSSRDNSAT